MPHVRPAEPSEIATLEDILRRASLANPNDRLFLQDHPDVMVVDPAQIEAGRIYVAEREGQAVGFASILPPAGTASEVDGVFVAPEHWRKGVGAALIGACIARARAEGAVQLHAVVNPHALEFYSSLGFELSNQDRVEVQAGVAYVMCRRI